MIAANMHTRREFLYGAAAGVAFATFGCRVASREAVLKIPEDAEECFHLFKFFTDPALGFEQARTGLGLTGEPKVLQSSPEWRRNTFENQNGSASSVQLNTTTDEHGEYLSGIYINYAKPIGISLSTMKANFGSATEHFKKVPVYGSYSPASFTNLMPGQREKEVMTYGFYPEPIRPGDMKVSVLFRADATYWDTKTVDFLRLERRPT
jgi:hypothetical protein